MSNFDQLMRRLSSQLDSMESNAEDRRKKKDQFDADIRDREMAETEANGQIDRKLKRDGALMAAEKRSSDATTDLSRHNDAFEVSAGRMSPELYNMRYYGGAAPTSGNVSYKTKSGLQDKDILKEYNDLKMSDVEGKWKDFNGSEPDFQTYRTSVMDSIGQGQTQDGVDYFKNQRAKLNANEQAGAMEFEKGMQTSRLPGGELSVSMNPSDGAAQGWKQFQEMSGKRAALMAPAVQPVAQAPAPAQAPVDRKKKTLSPDFQKPGNIRQSSVTRPTPRTMTAPAPLVDTQSFKGAGSNMRSFVNQSLVPAAQTFNKMFIDPAIDFSQRYGRMSQKSQADNIRKWQGGR